ncbi:MAG: response regulator transcription factor [Bacteroidetes bacterium]|nr:response regulator transcription factor [Bacteroidota bacterium]MCB0844621.1 response regulator transcription factor [Bacteroidota bacterium]
MKLVLIDNESSIHEVLRNMLSLYCPRVQIIGEAFGVAEGLALLSDTQPDCVFLDVEMDDGTGMDLLKQVSDRDFEVVFITAYDHYALDAFRFSALDFLLKPIDPDELMRAVEKVEKTVSKSRLSERISILENNLQTISSDSQKIVLKDTESIHILKISQILYCQAEGSYTHFHIDDGRNILVSRNLKEYEKLLKPHRFFRSHHSYLVNINQIIRFDRSEGGILVMTNKAHLPVSNRRKDQLMDILNHL